MLIPVADTTMRRFGDVSAVFAEWLSLVELSRDSYPPTDFLCQLTLILLRAWTTRVGWTGNNDGARMATLLQAYCEEYRSLELDIRRQVLVQQDDLVGYGDRHSATLQVSEWLPWAACA